MKLHSNRPRGGGWEHSQFNTWRADLEDWPWKWLSWECQLWYETRHQSEGQCATWVKIREHPGQLRPGLTCHLGKYKGQGESLCHGYSKAGRKFQMYSNGRPDFKQSFQAKGRAVSWDSVGRVRDSGGISCFLERRGSAGHVDIMRGCKVLTTFSHVGDKCDIVERVGTEARLLWVSKELWRACRDEK